MATAVAGAADLRPVAGHAGIIGAAAGAFGGRGHSHRLAHAREVVVAFGQVLGVQHEVLDVGPRGLIGLLKAVDERAALDRDRPAQRVDAPARERQPRRDGEVAAQDVAWHPVPPDDEVAAVRGIGCERAACRTRTSTVPDQG